MEEWPPPWVALPDLSPDDPATQGMAEAYIVLSWLPFWQTLSPAAKAEYLDRWHASAEWRDAITSRYDWEAAELEQEAREEADRLDRHGPYPPHRPWWRIWQ
jgi:hypothetical protein